MKAIWYEELGPARRVLQYGDIDDPTPGPGEVLVRLKYSGVNPIDVKRRQGGRGGISASRVVPHFDGAGIVDEVGPGIDSRLKNSRVWVYKAQWNRASGTAAEMVVLPADCAVPLPNQVGFDAGACLGIPALTAYPSVFADGPVSGKALLITGGAGAVGSYAIQFAKLAGAMVISTVSSEQKSELATEFGADHVINYQEEDVAARVLELTEGQGVDRIVEVEFGGNLDASVAAIKNGGVIATYASQAVPEPKIPFYTLMYKGVVVRHILTFLSPPETERAAVDQISIWLASGQLKHHVAERFPLTDTATAHEKVEAGAVGKVLVEI